jgi:pantoate--beta-alanine ligase
MLLAHTISEVREATAAARREGKTIGLVPTMGALHEGHLTLVRRAREQCGFVAVTIFVNPTQFGPSEDFTRYPRTLDADSEMCREAGVDLIFAPSPQEMYPEGFDTCVEVGGVTEMLEGASRPGHFRGVATVCLKLVSVCQPTRAYFGQKDYQQLQVITKMVRDLNLPLEIVPVEIVREPDGLAMSSRNRYLSADERRAALVLSKSLSEAKSAFDSGERSAPAIQSLVRARLDSEPLASTDYAVVVDAGTLLPLDTITRPAVILLAVRIGATRLIDNTVLPSLNSQLACPSLTLQLE